MSEEPIKGRIFNPDPVIYTAKTVVPCPSCAALRARVERMEKVVVGVREVIHEYLSLGGLFNPEMMEQRKVGEMMVETRDALAALTPEKAKSEGEV